MKVIGDERWSWLLHQDGEQLFLTVMCGSVGIYDVSFELTSEEAKLYCGNELSNIGRLVDAVRSKPENFMNRSIKGFLALPAVVNAGKEWADRAKQP